MKLAQVLEVLYLPGQLQTLRVLGLQHDGTPEDAQFVAFGAQGAAVGDVVLLTKEDDAQWRVLDIVTSTSVAARESTQRGPDQGRIV
jgi:microcompartment protein CcmK/EutM